MKKLLLFTLCSFLFAFNSNAQCPDLLQAMVNSCGTTEGNNEFVVFKTNTTALASDYTLNYGTSNPPVLNNLAGSDASVVTGTGTVTTTSTCSLISVTNPATSIPSGSRVIFIPTTLDQNYDVTGLCNGSSSLYVVFIKTNSNGGVNSNWNTTGTLSNSTATSRYLQVVYGGSSSCDGTNAPVKRYTASGNWASLSGVLADGNFVTWNDTTALYNNNGCNTIILPITLLKFNATFFNNSNIIYWQTSNEVNASNFEIEKSYDAHNFGPIKMVAATGINNELNNYRFVDNAIEYKTTYYRLKSYDRDGKFVVSKVVKVNPSKNGLNISNIFPVPAKNNITIEWNSDVKCSSSLTIMDLNGRVLKSQRIQTVQGFNQLNIDVSNFVYGQYIVKIITDNNVVTGLFTK